MTGNRTEKTRFRAAVNKYNYEKDTETFTFQPDPVPEWEQEAADLENRHKQQQWFGDRIAKMVGEECQKFGVTGVALVKNDPVTHRLMIQVMVYTNSLYEEE